MSKDTVKVKATQPIIEPTRKYKIGDTFNVTPERAKQFEENGVAKITKEKETEKEVTEAPKDKMQKGNKTKNK